jgi:hypothetical protein
MHCWIIFEECPFPFSSIINYPLKDQGVFFSKIAPNLPFLAQEAQMNFFSHFFALLAVGSCTRLLGEHMQKASRHLTARIVIL